MMKEITRTLIFVVVAAASATVAAVTHFVTQPVTPEVFGRVGEEFYPAFDPTKAAALEVMAYDEDTATVRKFEVALKDGRWVIPTHHDYPADAEDRLEKTAASVVDIKRGSMVGRQPSSYERFGVIDPLPQDDTVTTLKGRGQRLTLKSADGTILADYIIGKQVEEQQNAYYVRHPKEKEVYIAELNIDLSTKFADWIEDDLLKMERDDLTKIVIDKYSIRELGLGRLSMVDRETSELTREKWSDPWKLAGLDEEQEEVDSDKVRQLVNDLDGLKIVGVRKKPRGINADLSFDREYVRNQGQLDALVAELESKGFYIVPDPDAPKSEDPKQPPQFRLAADEGELLANTNEGVVYTLRFGELFTGSAFDIEVGFASSGDRESTAKPEPEEGQDEPAKDDDVDMPESSAEEGESEDKNSDLKKSRYLFVSVGFDESLIPDKPQPPAKPEEQPAAESNTEKSTNDAAEEPPSDAETDTEKPADSGNSESEASSENADSKPAADESQDPEAEYEAALKTYNEDLKMFEEKVQQGQKQAEELAERFADWYYVISGESFENLRLTRSELVKPKEADDEGNEKKEMTPGGAAAGDSGSDTDDTPATAPKPADAMP